MCIISNCHLVHPGEEGLRRKFFPGRQVIDHVTGKSKQQKPCVRLVGLNKDDIPAFYLRRAKKMSWLDWCLQESIEHPFIHYQKIRCLGDTIYTKVKEYLSIVESDTRANGCWAEGFTAGHATAMILESLSTNTVEAEEYVKYLLTNGDEFERTIVECLCTYADASK